MEAVGADVGKKGFQRLIDNAVNKTVDKELGAKIDPRLAAIESRISAIETRLELADRLARLEAELSAMKAKS